MFSYDWPSDNIAKFENEQNCRIQKNLYVNAAMKKNFISNDHMEEKF